MDYWQLKEIIQKLVPRKSLLEKSKKADILIKAWGRKENLKEFNFESREFKPYGRERILPKDIIYGFTEVSVRACHCPMPLNMDVYSPATTGCQYKCLYCVPSGTKILMSDGREKSIEYIRTGEFVISYNEKNESIEYCEVLDTMKRDKEELVCIDTGDETLRLSKEHPVFTKRGWIKAEDLLEEDEILVWN